MIEVPDYAEPFETWRVWKVVRHEGEYTLGSVVQRTLWPAGEAFIAECLRFRRVMRHLLRKRRHEAPEADCECGIYGAPLERVGQYVADFPCGGIARVVGQVALWGTVVECERGLRASHAYPRRIYVPADAGEPWRVSWDEVALSLWRYGVPVELLPSRATEATRVLAERQAA